MTTLADVLLGLWIGGVTIGAFVVLPALALGRPVGRRAWWPECVAGAMWSLLATIVLVPVLARIHLFNWATALLVPLAWPAALWLYRYRGAPAGAFRALCRRVTLRLLTARWPAGPLPRPAGWRRALLGGAALTGLYVLTARELRFASPADYDMLAETRALLDGGQWIADPLASVAAILSRLAAVDPMQAVRFVRPLTWPGSLIAALARTPSLDAAFAWSAALAAAVLTALSVTAVHRRDRRHVIAAALVAAIAFGVPRARAADGEGYVEYDAAPRQALEIARTFAADDWVIVAPMEQRVEVPEPRRFLALAEFVARVGDRAGDERFRFDVAGHDLFVFIEKTPLYVAPAATLAPVRYAPGAPPYWMPNARARLERRALQICESYRRSHAGVTVQFEDAAVRIYHVRH